MPLKRLWSWCSLRLRRVTRATSRNPAGPATHFDRLCRLNLQLREHGRSNDWNSINVPCSGSGIAASRWLNHPPHSVPIVLGGGSSSSKLVRDDPYPRFFIRSRKVEEDPDADEYDPELVPDLYDASERRGGGSGGASGMSPYDDLDDSPREGIIFASERCGRTERVVGGARVDVPTLGLG